MPPRRTKRRAASAGEARRASTRFDRDYYTRFYLDPRTAVVSRAEMRARARLIAAFAQHIGLPVKSILDAGCGIGMLRAPLQRAFPRAVYVGLEGSEYLCRRYGWTRGSLEAWRARQPFDLVVCYDVLQYLDDHAAVRAIANLGRLCRGVLYFSALTHADWRHNCDRRRTDPNVRLRTGEWYRTRLARAFRPIGAGFWLRRGAPLVAWEMETA
ncbi:MAG: class I SAM-dependent methyltransferase [Steroidobacteraceae bacterium]